MSELKAEKSRENGALSQGPVTAEGRARSSQNATKLGIFSQRRVLPGESQADFNQLVTQLIADLEPSGALEMYYIDEVAKAMWHKQRLDRAILATVEKEQMAFQLGSSERKWDEMGPGFSLKVHAFDADYREKLSTVRDDLALRARSIPKEDERFARVAVSLDRSLERAIRGFREAQAHRRASLPGVIVSSDSRGSSRHVSKKATIVVESADAAVLADTEVTRAE